MGLAVSIGMQQTIQALWWGRARCLVEIGDEYLE